MEKYRKTIGRHGEDAAEKYLKKKRYKILERNFLIRGGEIDIIAQKGEYIVFIEVKTRCDMAFGTPAEAVTFRKIRSMKKTAEVYMQQYGEAYVRFDVIEVHMAVTADKPRLIQINHIENAFM